MDKSLYLALIIWSSTVHTNTTDEQCPDVCNCEIDDLQCHYYFCQEAEITEIPSNFHINSCTINLINNKIEILPGKIFDGLVELFEIELRNNQIQVLPADIFKTNTKLTYLDLSNNLIEILPNGVFSWNIELGTLLLSGNEIKVLPNGIFRNNTGLYALDLDENPIETFYEGVFSAIVTGFIFISFNCICMEKSFHQLIQQELNVSMYKVKCIGSPESLWTSCQDTDMLTLYNANTSTYANECSCVEKTSIVDPMFSTSFPNMTPTLPTNGTNDDDFPTSDQNISVSILHSTKSRTFVTPFVATGIVVGTLCGAASVTTIIVNIVRRILHMKKIKMKTKEVDNCEEGNQTNYCMEKELSLFCEHVKVDDLQEDIRTMRILNIPPICHVTQL